MTELWRCFVAAPLDDALRSALAASVATWSKELPAGALRWSAPESWHLTLAFLGSLDPVAVGCTREIVSEIARRHEPMSLESGGLGVFPSSPRARVVWYGIDDADGRLAALAADLAASLELETAAPFRAHVSLARAGRESADLREWLAGASASAPSGTLEVGRLDLVRSHLGTGAPTYETLATMELGGSVSA